MMRRRKVKTVETTAVCASFFLVANACPIAEATLWVVESFLAQKGVTNQMLLNYANCIRLFQIIGQDK